LLWQSEALEKDTYSAPIVANREYAYTVTGARLLAFKRTDGSKAWESTLADEVSLSLCPNCLRVVDDYVAVLTDDGTLQVFDAGTGRTAWFVKANQDSPRGLHLINGQLAFMDNDDDGAGILRVFDPATGDPGPATKPECMREFGGADNVYWYTPLSLAPDGSDFYFAYGFPQVCVQRYDGETLELTWETVIDYAIGSIDKPQLVTEADVILSFDSAIFAVDAATGEMRPLAEDEDYDLQALGVHDELVLVLAVRTRGSRRYELWALDKDSGERVWDVDFADEQPLDADPSIIDDGKSVWTWHPSANGLVILRFNRAEDDVSHAALLETLSWEGGETSGQTSIHLGLNTIILSAPAMAGWTQDTAWFSIENTMMGLDTARGEIVYRWP
jgi:outer membrane protein assembly factor BamB